MFLLQGEREKTALLASLQEAQTQLQHTQGALSEQSERVRHLSRELDDPQEEAGGPAPPDAAALQVLQCKYKVAVTEVMGLKAEMKALKETFIQAVEVQGAGPEDRDNPLSEQVCPMA